MRQMALPVRLADHARFENFLATGNEVPLRVLEEAAAGHGPRQAWLFGACGTGKTHLLQATVAAAAQHGRRAAYLPLGRDHGGLPPGALEGLAQVALLCLDDVQSVAADPDWQVPLFRLWEEARETGACLVYAASAPPGDCGIALADLRSRLAAVPTWRVQPLDEAGRVEALKQRARFRGLELPDDTAWFLMRRVSRATGELFSLLDALDDAALVEQKALTIPFVRRHIGAARSP